MKPLESAALARSMTQPAFISVLPADHIAALQAAAGTGPLAGMTFAAKDNIDLAGVPTTAANPAVTEPASSSATAITLLLNAGAVPVGKTNLDQYATGLVGTRSPYGVCHSVYSDLHVSGGSSSGSAVAVASGVVDFALGTDTAGSGRVPAAFNGLVGLKATKGLISTTGVLPACRSLDCVTVLTKTVGLARKLFHTLAVFDPADPYSRTGVQVKQRGNRPRIGVPALGLDLDPVHQPAWELALQHAATVGDLVTVDVSPFLQAAELLYSGPWLAERTLAFGAQVAGGGAGIDPTVRQIVAAGPKISAEDAFRGMYRLAELSRQTEPSWELIDVLLLPTTPTHPSLAEVAAEPVAVNSRLGRFTNMTNLLDLAAVAIPAGMRADGLPFGVQLLGPAFSDLLLLDLAAAWLGEQPVTSPTVQPETVLLAVAGAHLTGQPLNSHLTGRGATLNRTTTMASGYRMYEVSGPIPRPGVTRITSEAHAGHTALQVEVWNMPFAQLGTFVDSIAPPLAIGPVELADGSRVLGFVCSADGVDPARDITDFGGWRSYLDSKSRTPG